MPPTHSLIALKQYMKGAGCLCGGALSVIASQCHLPQRGRHWHIGSAHADRAKLCITQNAGPCRPDSQVRCCESRPQGPVVIVMRSDLPGLPRALPLKDSLRPEGDVAFSDRGRTSCRASARLRGLVLRQRDALSVNAFRRCHLSRSERQELFRHVLGSPFGRAVERQRD